MIDYQPGMVIHCGPNKRRVIVRAPSSDDGDVWYSVIVRTGVFKKRWVVRFQLDHQSRYTLDALFYANGDWWIDRSNVKEDQPSD